MRFLRPNVRTRIYAGFALLVAVGLGLTGIGVYRLSDIGIEVRTMDVLATGMQRVLDTGSDLEALRRTEIQYRLDGADTALNEARASMAQVRDLLREVGQAERSEERRGAYRGVLETLSAHEQHLGEFTRLTRAALEARTRLFSVGDAVSEAADTVVSVARASDNKTVSDDADAVDRALLLVRAASWQFVATLDEAGLETFQTGAGKARSLFTRLERDADTDVGALIGPARATLAEYEASFNAYAVSKLGADDLYKKQMQPQILAMQTQLRTASTALRQSFDESRTTVSGGVASASLLEEALAGMALLLGSVMAMVIGRSIVRPLTGMTRVMKQLAAGDHTVEIPACTSADEIGDMARAVEVFKQNAIEAGELAAAQQDEQAAKARRQAAMELHTQNFGASVSAVMSSLAASSDTMRLAAAAMAEAAGGVHGEATSTAGSAAKSSEDLVSVAAAVEQLTSSVDEISRQVAAAAGVAREAVQRADAGQTSIRDLTDSTVRIGDVVHLISNIAGQTNLLALNATIEAARAGEAGKGFAVVAGEVKALAAQTAKATAEIGSQIETVRGATEQTITAMTEIGGIIGRMGEVTAAISAAVEEQSATTREIAGSVQAVSHATALTARAMDHVVIVADKAGRASQDVSEGAAGIGRDTDTLRSEVDQFLAAVRS
jgi:methyl-accepting chemotaxis protein